MVFSNLVDVADKCGLGMDQAFTTPVANPRVYATQRNAEHVNEVVAGVRWSFLTETQASPAFTKITDFFTFPVEDGLALHVVQEQHPTNLQFFMHDTIRSVPDLPQLRMVQSVLAQVLLALECAQSELHATHFDLHIGNVMLKEGKEGEGWVWERPGHRPSFFIPSADLKGKQAVLIDFGRSRIDHPYHPGDERYAAHVELSGCPPQAKFDPFVDARAFAHDVARWILFPWTERFVRVGNGQDPKPVGSPPSRLGEQKFAQLYGVLEAMLGLRSFLDWNANGDLTRSRMGPVPKSLAQLFTYFPDGHTKISRVRTNEFFFPRPEQGFTPTEILSMPFFADYLNEKPSYSIVAQPRSFRARSRNHRESTREAKRRK